MPTDLTGTPTSLGIGTYNTSVDAPSGLGFNEAMAQIDALIAERIVVSNPAVGDGVVWNGTEWVATSAAATITEKPLGYELSHQERTAVLAVTATSEATSTTVITSDPITFDGTTPVWVEAYIPRVDGGNTFTQLWLFQDSTSLGTFGNMTLAGSGVPILMRRKLIVPTGSHTLSLRCSVFSGTATINAGPGGTTQVSPAYLSVTRA